MKEDLSKHQFLLMTELVEKRGGFISYDAAHTITQGTFGSFLNPKRGYLKWVRGKKGWKVTEAALQARQSYLIGDISRAGFERPLSHYFDPVAYGLAEPKPRKPPKRKLHIVAA